MLERERRLPGREDSPRLRQLWRKRGIPAKRTRQCGSQCNRVGIVACDASCAQRRGGAAQVRVVRHRGNDDDRVRKTTRTQKAQRVRGASRDLATVDERNIDFGEAPFRENLDVSRGNRRPWQDHRELRSKRRRAVFTFGNQQDTDLLALGCSVRRHGYIGRRSQTDSSTLRE